MKQSRFEKLGKYIVECDDRNVDNKYDLSALRGVSINKEFIESKANMDGVSISPYKLVKPNEFCYVTITSRNGERISLAQNSSHDTYIVSSSYIVFKIIDESLLLPDYLYLILSKPEFDRYARFNSWGSAREALTFESMKLTDVCVPSPEEQQKVVNAWKAFREIKEQNEAKAAPLMQLCQSYIQELKHNYVLSEIGPHLQFYKEKNKDQELSLEQGINISKEFITPQRTNSDLSSRIKVRTGQFAYCTQLNNENVAIAYRTGPDCVVSPVYEVFEIKQESVKKLLPEYLFLWLSRPEFGRYVYWSSVGSAYEFLRFDNLYSYKIAFPPIDVQRAIVNIYKCANEAKQIAAEADRLSREVCPALLQHVIHSENK
jgi:type I restriction enzyme S subunit